jgi:HSP20 family protein
MALFSFSHTLDPVSGLLTLQRELDRVFQKPLGFDLGVSGRGVFPPINVFSEPDRYVVKLEVAGVPPNELHIETHGRTLTISGKRERQAPEHGSLHRRERSTGDFSRSLQLPEMLDPSRAEATYKHGILTINIPKKEEAKPHQITVKAA